MTVELADDLAALLPELKEPVDKAVRELFVIELFRRELLSSRKAAQMLGMEWLDFVRLSGERGIPYFRYDPGELEREVTELNRLLGS